MDKEQIIKDAADQFVKKFPNQFNVDHWFWVQEIEELLEKTNTRIVNSNIN